MYYFNSIPLIPRWSSNEGRRALQRQLCVFPPHCWISIYLLSPMYNKQNFVQHKLLHYFLSGPTLTCLVISDLVSQCWNWKMALNPNYEAIGKAFTTQYYQVLQGFLLFIIWPLPITISAYAWPFLCSGTSLMSNLWPSHLVGNIFFGLLWGLLWGWSWGLCWLHQCEEQNLFSRNSLYIYQGAPHYPADLLSIDLWKVYLKPGYKS